MLGGTREAGARELLGVGGVGSNHWLFTICEGLVGLNLSDLTNSIHLIQLHQYPIIP